MGKVRGKRFCVACVKFSEAFFCNFKISFQEIDDLVQLGKDEMERSKRPRLDSDVDQPAGGSTSSIPIVERPVIKESLVEDDSHFLLSRDLSKKDQTSSPAAQPEVKTEVKTEPNGNVENGHAAPPNGQHVKDEGTIKAISVSSSPDRPKLIMSIKKSDLNMTVT